MDKNRKETLEAFKEKIRGKLIVSCQVLPGEPLYSEQNSVMGQMTQAAQMAGAAAVCAGSVTDIQLIKKETSLPVIGLIKKQYPGYDICMTPTMAEVDQLYAAGADVIAADSTVARRGDGLGADDFLRQIHEKYPNVLLMANISSFEEGLEAWMAGADILGITLNRHIDRDGALKAPDIRLVHQLAQTVDLPVIGAGGIQTPDQARQMLEAGAFSVIVGSAITRPQEIAARFVAAMENKDLKAGSIISPERSVH